MIQCYRFKKDANVKGMQCQGGKVYDTSSNRLLKRMQNAGAELVDGPAPKADDPAKPMPVEKTNLSKPADVKVAKGAKSSK